MTNKITRAQIEKIFPKDGQKNCEFILGAHNHKQFPQSNLSEFAFIGASNVGKSSLINALTSQKVAIASNTPGRTRQVNFFRLAEKLMIVDMPGYGFARAHGSAIENWQRTCFEYFKNRRQLKKVFLLIDPIKGLKDSDEEMINVFNAFGVIFQVVLTKIDKVKTQELEEVKNNIEQKMNLWPAIHPQILCVSAKNNNGLDDIRIEILQSL